MHWLCLSNSTYSELTSALPSQLVAQQEALDKVCNLSHVPTRMNAKSASRAP